MTGTWPANDACVAGSLRASGHEVRVLEMRRSKPFWGPRRLALELAKKGVTPTTSASAIYRCLLRAGLVQPGSEAVATRDWKRWERGAAMELWQLDVVGGFHLAHGTTAKALTGLDDHSSMVAAY